MWNPETSTILQVLVSIQGLVLVPKPYYNEAGCAAPPGHSPRCLPCQAHPKAPVCLA